MSQAQTCELPPAIAQRLAEFCAAAKTGFLQIDVKEGLIVGAKLTESVRIEKARN